MNRYYNKADIVWPMPTDFEHDKRQLVIRFPFTDRQRLLIFRYVLNFLQY